MPPYDSTDEARFTSTRQPASLAKSIASYSTMASSPNSSTPSAVGAPSLNSYLSPYQVHSYPYLHDASANKNVHVSNASKTTHPETHLETLVCVVLVLVGVPFAWWTMMAELCYSVDDFVLDFFSNRAADTASEHDGYGHRRCCPAATVPAACYYAAAVAGIT